MEVNPKKQTLSVELTNLQIINGCQTVNALYSAKYREDTKNKFKPSNVLIKIYQISPNQQRFKQNVIKATNNQNAVKTYSLYANDPIQIEIQNILKKLGYLYDRKGESKQEPDAKIVSMVQSSLAYRATFEFGAQKLRSKIGQSRVFQKDEYEKIYKDAYLENRDELNKLSIRLLLASLILDGIRDNIKKKANNYIIKLPIIKKSTYYLAGLYYATHERNCEDFINKCITLLEEDNSAKIKNIKLFDNFNKHIADNFDTLVQDFQSFFEEITLDKKDIDNLLKDSKFGKEYESHIENKRQKS